MQIVRLILWLVVTALFALFTYANWFRVEVKIWEDLRLETPLPMLVVVAFLLGLVPMWVLHHSKQWRLMRRVRSLENAAQTATAALLANTPEPEPEPLPAPAPDLSGDANPKPEQA